MRPSALIDNPGSLSLPRKGQREAERLSALRDLAILDTPEEEGYDTITCIAAQSLQADTASLTFVDETRVWAKSVYGGHLRELPRFHSFAERVIAEKAPFVVLDLECEAPGSVYSELSRALHLRFLAGVPVFSGDGQVVGVLSVGGHQPRRQMRPEDLSILSSLAGLITDQLELRRFRAAAPLDSPGNTLSEPDTSAAHAALAAVAWPSPEDLRSALDQEQFVLFYQPEVDIVTRRIVGLEALIRWQHPTRGLIPPMEFIPQAEGNGLILPIGDWGLGQACRQLQKWQRNRPWMQKIRVCVNLSARQFSRVGLVDHVESLLQQNNLSGCQLGLEMTESSLIPSMATAVNVLSSLRDLGVSLHMDDFGTGYSSLSHLHRFPFDVLKIDRSFVQRIRRGEQSLQIVQTIIELARVLGMDVVAEGIETEDQLLLLKEMGCRFGQGYLFATPLPADKIEELLASPDNCLPMAERPTQAPPLPASSPRRPGPELVPDLRSA